MPEELSVIGFDDLPVARWPVFELTTVRVPFHAMSEAVVDLLIRRMEGHAPEAGRVFPTELVLRSTHGPAPDARAGR